MKAIFAKIDFRLDPSCPGGTAASSPVIYYRVYSVKRLRPIGTPEAPHDKLFAHRSSLLTGRAAPRLAPGNKLPGYSHFIPLETSAKASLFQSVILSEARRKVLLSSTGESERSRRTSWFSSEITEADSARSRKSWPAALSRRQLAVRRTSAFRQPGSFDSGSATSFGQTHLPLAFAQDDGAFFYTAGLSQRSPMERSTDLKRTPKCYGA